MKLLNDMALFVEVIKANSFRGAAEAVGLPNSTVSRRIAELERRIGLRLLNRTTRRIELTEGGRLYYERCRRIVDEARLAHEEISDLVDNPSGLIRLSMPIDFGVVYLAPLLAEFAERYPQIQFDLDLTPKRLDLIRDPVDLVIRIGALPDSQLVARPLGTLQRNLFASPSYLARHGVPSSPAELLQHQCLRMLDAPWILHAAEQKVSLPIQGRYLLNNIGMLRRLALLGQGIAMLVDEMIGEDLAQGRLQHVLPGWRAEALPVYAITETRLVPAKVRVLIDFLSEQFNRE
ncbi:LysR family transcriptional regulator [Ectopseudomonas toyotomiensis]|uniref:DNA-binding transcriptional regulator, LysR family n=1 Tax=Ectopseudomonas toyotomiensis TaxID=554344 RepID=A0A1I5QR25_9GAMM|nr:MULTISPECIES: LysR family transcriptional regulator [Pseudomonas]PIA74160.1 LysR family transcriptional regulator [Pseudomonas toyotomiensis]SDA57936.1 DNA-binding transcriptional regulator, LysR family [Pseudomonas sp. NFPP33]SFP48719.1 DNA-binding transcriptional regulator, LysR family [Pseudomonas toyotomiensis]